MRATTFVLFSMLALPLACSTAPSVSVYRLGVGDKSEGLQGDPVKVRRPPQEAYAGSRPGYWAIRTSEDWTNAWGQGREAPMPVTLDMASTMVLLAQSDSVDAVDVKITRVVESTGFLHVWVREAMRGEGCVKHAGDQRPHDAVLAPRVEKPVKFYVEEEKAETCGDAPKVEAKCRLMDSKDWVQHITAQLGDMIECTTDAETRGSFAVVDRALMLTDLPAGSDTKLQYHRGPTRATFRVDVFGNYVINAEAIDESGRKGTAKVEITATPPKSKEPLIQILWTSFGKTDDQDTFPRLSLYASTTGAPKRECSLDKQPPELCELRRYGAYTVMKLRPSDEKMPLTVRYLDERAEKGPAPCIQVWFDGVRTAEACDRKHRDPDERWEVGVLDAATGKLGEPLAATPADAGVEAGAPKKPAPKK